MARFSLLTYLRLKALITIIRLVTRWKARPVLRRDQQLADALYPGVQRTRIRIPSRTAGRTVAADLYLPPSSSSSSSSSLGGEKPRPVLVNWHGSGFVITGLLGTNALWCARAAHELAVPVLDADYRKAPEHPFPAAVHDAEDVLRWVGGGQPGLDASRVVVSGFSAGGSLALGAASVLRAGVLRGLGVDVVGVVGVYPSTDNETPPADKKAPKEGIDPMDVKTMEMFVECYTPDEESRRNPLASPVRAGPSMYPDTVGIFTCEGDPLAPEGLELVQRLEDGERKVVSKMLLDVGHGFDAGAEKGTVKWERREEMYRAAIETLKEALAL